MAKRIGAAECKNGCLPIYARKYEVVRLISDQSPLRPALYIAARQFAGRLTRPVHREFPQR